MPARAAPCTCAGGSWRSETVAQPIQASGAASPRRCCQACAMRSGLTERGATMKYLGPVCVAACAWALTLSVHALDKAQPDSVSGHGQARDQYLLKGTETRANCGGPVSTQRNPAT